MISGIEATAMALTFILVVMASFVAGQNDVLHSTSHLLGVECLAREAAR